MFTGSFACARARPLALLFLAMLASCGGNVVVDGESESPETTTSGTSTSSTTDTTTETTTTPTPTTTKPLPSCEELTDAFQQALAEARACDVCSGPESCEYLSGQPLSDICGCPTSVSLAKPEVVQAAGDAYQAWKGAGCGPYDCGQECEVSSNPGCNAYGNCVGTCMP